MKGLTPALHCHQHADQLYGFMFCFMYIYLEKREQIVNIIMKQICRLVPTSICNLSFAVENLSVAQS